MPYNGIHKEKEEWEDQETPGRETQPMRWKNLDINGKTKPDWPKTGQNGGVLLVANVAPRYKGLKQ